MPDWYLVHTKVGKENSVGDELSRWLPEVLLPKLRVRVYRWRKLVTTVAPLFPCYIFAAFAAERELSRVKYTSGVRGVVSGGEEPLVVEPSIIDQLKVRCALVLIEPPTKHLKNGDPVVIAEGALRGFEAVFDRYLSGPQRVAILLSTMAGAPLRVVLPTRSLVSGGAF
jgi:transcriptional antiterminator RfaH